MILLLLLAGLPLQDEIARLGDPRREVRREAGRRLLAVGDSAVPELIKALKHEDVEVRRGVTLILDHQVARKRRGKRNCQHYKIPDNNQTRTLAGPRGRQLQAVFLGRENIMRHYAAHYRGVLISKRWRKPTLADYLGLLDSLEVHMRGTVDPTVDRNMLEHVFAMDSVAGRLLALHSPTHWTVRWVVRRRVLPGIAYAMSGRGRDLSSTEARIYRGLLHKLKPVCDSFASVQRLRLLKRLTRQ